MMYMYLTLSFLSDVLLIYFKVWRKVKLKEIIITAVNLPD